LTVPAQNATGTVNFVIQISNGTSNISRVKARPDTRSLQYVGANPCLFSKLSLCIQCGTIIQPTATSRGGKFPLTPWN